MAGTNSAKIKNTTLANLSAPTIILVEPQLGENIGMAARAMLNCGLSDLRLVNPRDGWPSESANATAAGANQVIKNTSVYGTTAEAVSDLNLVFAATARKRDMINRIVTPRQAAKEMHETFNHKDESAGVLFGPESKGLSNNDVTSEHHFEPTSTSNAVDCTDDRFVEVTRVVQSSESSGAVIRIGNLSTLCDILKIPSCTEELFPLPGEDCKTLGCVVTKPFPHPVELTTVFRSDGIGFTSTEGNFQNTFMFL